MNQAADNPIPADAQKQLLRRSDRKGLVQLGAHLGLLALSAAALSQATQGKWFIAPLLVYGIVLVFLFTPLHESIHLTAFKTRWINRAVSAVFGFLLLIPTQYFRIYHLAHHAHTQDIDKDPELIGRKSFKGVARLWYISGLPFWWGNIRTIFEHACARVSESYLPARYHRKIIFEARIHAALYLILLLVSLVSGSHLLWWFWVLPALVGQPFLRLFLLAEHRGCDFSSNMLENSRTTYASPVTNFLCWNMPFHAEHHYLPSVPFHALPALHAFIGTRVKYRGDGYASVLGDILRQPDL